MINAYYITTFPILGTNRAYTIPGANSWITFREAIAGKKSRKERKEIYSVILN